MIVMVTLYILDMPKPHFLEDLMILAKFGALLDHIAAALLKLAAQLQVDIDLPL